MEAKHYSGLRLVDATRLAITNHDTSQASISVNGRPLGYQDIDLGSLRVTANKTYTLDEEDGEYYQVLNTNSEIEITFEDEVQPGKVASGQIIPAGSSLFKQQSPAPFVFIDTTGRLGSSNLWNNLWIANVMGHVDVDKGSNTYKHGLVPEGSDVHDGLFLRKDGQWGQPSVWTGSVSETLLSLQDTPTTYTNHIDKYLRVSFAEGGSVVFDAIDTSKVPEHTDHLYYTDDRVNTRIDAKLADQSVTDVHITGTLTANEVETESDVRLKRHITDLPPDVCLAVCSELQPKSYEFKSKPGRQRYGLLAHQLQSVLPSLASTTTNGHLAVNYLDLIPILIGSIQKLDDQLKSLQQAHDLLLHSLPPHHPPCPVPSYPTPN